MMITTCIVELPTIETAMDVDQLENLLLSVSNQIRGRNREN